MTRSGFRREYFGGVLPPSAAKFLVHLRTSEYSSPDQVCVIADDLGTADILAFPLFCLKYTVQPPEG